MSTFSKTEVLLKLQAVPVVPVFFHADAQVAKEVVRACYEGGIRVFEFTNRGDRADEVLASLISFLRSECKDMALGAGAIVEEATAARYLQLGADFIVGPLFNERVARTCHRRGVAYVPGCGTITEVGNAQEIGCDLVKVFPGEVLTPRFVKALLAPMPWSRVMVTGGVEPTRENLAEWFKAGAACVGMGSKLFPKTVIANQDWKAIQEKCQEVVQLIHEIR